jgi:hypothetical protein
MRTGCIVKLSKLQIFELNTLVQKETSGHVEGKPPHSDTRLAAVADMANSLRDERNLDHVGANWPSTFVKRQPELKVKFNRKYDYKRALCEDPEVI